MIWTKGAILLLRELSQLLFADTKLQNCSTALLKKISNLLLLILLFSARCEVHWIVNTHQCDQFWQKR